MKNGLFSLLFLLFALPTFGSSDTLAVSIFNKCQKAHANLKNNKIVINSQFFQKNGDSFSSSGEAIISKSATYVKMLGIENITLLDKGIMVQVQESENLLTIYALPENSTASAKVELNNPDVFKAIRGLTTNVQLQYKLVAENSSYYTIHIFTLQQWTYDLIALKVLKSSYLLSEITFLIASQNNSDVNRAITKYTYSDLGTLPEKLKLDYYIERKNKKWSPSKRFAKFKLNDFTS